MLSRVGARLLNRPFALVQPTAFRSARFLNTVVTTQEAEDKILQEQRKNRPTSPHLTIYQPQLTWYLSSVHRLSGIFLATTFYGVTISYALGSLLGYPIDSTAIAELFHSLPTFAQIGAKILPGFLFFFHFGNGIRHLVWDTARELTLKGVYRTGYAVLAFSTVASLFYSFF